MKPNEKDFQKMDNDTEAMFLDFLVDAIAHFCPEAARKHTLQDANDFIETWVEKHFKSES